LPFTKRCLQS